MKIQLKRSNVLSSGVAKEPTSEQMEYGELAVNYSDSDPAIFLKDSNDNIIRIAGEGSVGSIISGDTFPVGVDEGTLFYNTSDNTLYYWNGLSWVAIKGDDVYVDVSGDNMTGNLTLGTNKITLNATSGAGAFTGKVTTASTVSGDGGTTVTTKNYVDNNRTVPGSGLLNIKDDTGVSLGTFNANATTGTETVISLPASVAPTPPGDGVLTIKNYNDSTAAEGGFTANQGTGSTITLKQIKYSDVSGTPSIPAAAGAGTLNIKDNTGVSLGTFNANATTGTETVISLPATVAPTEPGDGALTIKNYNDFTSASGSFSANQGTGSTITLKQIKYADISGTPSAPGNGTITIKQPGTSDQSFTVNQSGPTTITLKNDNTQNSTNLGNSTTTSAVTVTSSTGTNTTIAAATGSKAGVLSTAQLALINGALQKTGGTMTGALNVPASATGTQAPRVEEVVKKSGDSMTGDLNMNSGAVETFVRFNNTSGTCGIVQESNRAIGLFTSVGGSDQSVILDETGLILNDNQSGYTAGISYNSLQKVGFIWGSPNLAVWIDGVGFAGNLVPSTSDIRLKENVSPISNSGLDLVNALNPVTYTWKEEAFASKRYDATRQSVEERLCYGFIADEVIDVLPQASTTSAPTEKTPDPFKDYDNRAIIAMLTKAVQELSAEVEALKNGG